MTLHVVFRVAGADYALPATEVLQMESYAGATPVPGAAPWIAGLVQVRGRVIPVIDLGARFGGAAAAITADSRVVVVERGGRTVGLLVDLAREVRPLGDAAIAPPPEALREGGGFVRAIARDDQRLLMMLDLDRVLGEERHGQSSLPR